MGFYPVTVLLYSGRAVKAWTVFSRSDAGIVGSKLTQEMDVSVCVYFVFVLPCV
jgi:hypothetical protein